VVLEADAILHSTAAALQPLADLTATPLTTPTHHTPHQQQLRRSGAAGSASRGQGPGSGRLPPALQQQQQQQQQQQRAPSADVVCGAEEVLEVAAGLREWCGAMQQRLARWGCGMV